MVPEAPFYVALDTLRAGSKFPKKIGFHAAAGNV